MAGAVASMGWVEFADAERNREDHLAVALPDPRILGFEVL
jgi:hypothetical protein